METSKISDWIQTEIASTNYRPRNVIVIFKSPDLKTAKDLGFSDKGREEIGKFLEAMKSLFELFIMRTSIKAVENSTRLLQNDVQDEYSQDFAFVERGNKLVYNLFRQWRAKYQMLLTFDLLMFETDADCQNVVDAWEVTGLRVDQIRNDYVPRRDISKVSPDGPHYTTISVVGRLDHSWSVMEKATSELQRMNFSGFNTYRPVDVESTDE